MHPLDTLTAITQLDWINAMLAILTPAAIVVVLWDARATKRNQTNRK